MTRLLIDSTASDLGLANGVACVIRNVEQVSTPPEALREADSVIEDLRSGRIDPRSTRECQGFRQLFAELGYPSQLPAGERLINSFTKGGFRSFGILVDAYNIVALRSGCGLGMHDFSGSEAEDISVRRASGSETIIPIFKSDRISINFGDLIYSKTDGGHLEKSTTMAWLGKKDVDSELHRVRHTSTDIVLLALGNRNTSESFNLAVCKQVFERIRYSCPSAEAHILQKKHFGKNEFL